MVYKYNICVDISSEILTALCPSEHETLTKDAIARKLDCLLDECIEVSDHFVNINGVDNISVERI